MEQRHAMIDPADFSAQFNRHDEKAARIGTAG